MTAGRGTAGRSRNEQKVLQIVDGKVLWLQQN
jgi:hypothetical protein